MIKKLFKLFLGNTIASFGVVCLIKSGFGAFAITSANQTFASLFPISLGMAGFIVEALIMIAVLCMGEGISIASIVNMSYGSFMIDVFNAILPSHPVMIIGLLVVGIGWMLMDKSELGNTNSNLLMTTLIKKTGKSVGLIRAIEECIFLAIGFIGGYATWFTLALSLGLGYLLDFEYRLFKHDPSKMNHSYLIKGKCRNEVTELAISKESKE